MSYSKLNSCLFQFLHVTDHMGTRGKYLHCTRPCANTIHLEKSLNNTSATQGTYISFHFLLIVFIFCFNLILLFYHWLQHFC